MAGLLTMAAFPKSRHAFCETADGKTIYRVWRWCGKVQRAYWFGSERIQTAECQDDDFDIREFCQVSGDYEELMAQAKSVIESKTLAQLTAK